MSYRDRDRDEPYNNDRGSGRYSSEKRHADAAPKIFVGNIPYTTTDEDVKAHFEVCGRVQEVLIPRDPEQRIKGYGFITFEDFDSMDRAIRKMDGSTMLGNTLRVDRANERKERPAFDSSRAPPSRFEDTRGGYGGGERRERKPVGYRCRIMGLARDVGWQLLKDFLRQAGDVTYANVDPDGMGVGEYQSLSECKDAIEKLSGAALDGKIVKLTPLNFDFDTGERLDRSGGDRGGGGGGGYSSRGYDDRGRNDYGGRKDYDRRDDRRDDRDRRDYGGGGSRDYDRRGGGGGGGGGGSHRDYDRGGAATAGGRGGSYSPRIDGGGGRDYDRARSRERSPARAAAAGGGGGSYHSPRGAPAPGGGSGGRQYDSPRDNGAPAAPAAGGSSRYGGGGWAGGSGSSKYGGGGGAAAAAPPASSSRYGGEGGYRGAANGGDGGGGDGYGGSRGAGGPDRGSYRDARGSDRQGGLYDRPSSAR